MAQYDRRNVVRFMDSIRKADAFDIARIWAACAYRPEGPYRSDIGRVIDRFHDLPIWEQQAVLYEMAELVHRAALSAAFSRAQSARKTDPL
jgi:hypothetical protein